MDVGRSETGLLRSVDEHQRTDPLARHDAADGSHFTVEDAGSDVVTRSDLFDNDTTAGSSAAPADRCARHRRQRGRTRASATPGRRDRASDRGRRPRTSPSRAHRHPGAPEAPSTPTGGLAALVGDDSIGHVFDQTNGVDRRARRRLGRHGRQRHPQRRGTRRREPWIRAPHRHGLGERPQQNRQLTRTTVCRSTYTSAGCGEDRSGIAP